MFYFVYSLTTLKDLDMGQGKTEIEFRVSEETARLLRLRRTLDDLWKEAYCCIANEGNGEKMFSEVFERNFIAIQEGLDTEIKKSVFEQLAIASNDGLVI